METQKHESKPFRADSWSGKDLLGRAGFAERLAEKIKPLATEQSLVIGIFGPWGSGKSIVKQMTLDRLAKQDEKTRPLVLEFNAWEWSGHEEMTKAMFKQIRISLRKKDRGKISQRAAKLLKYYESYLTTVSVSLEGLSKTAQASLLAFVSLAAFAFSDKFTTGLSKEIGYVVGGIAAVIPILKFGTELIKTLKETFSGDAELREKTLPELKEVLSTLLGKLERPLLIAIDDVDRLSADEIKCLFQLIKQNLNFPRIIYLLFMDKAYVEKALQETFKVTSGKEYLKKIIHVGFDLPHIERKPFEKTLKNALTELYAHHNVTLDSDRLRSLFLSPFPEVFRNLRDVNRFLDTMDFHLTLFKRGTVLEVDPIDLAAVEVLRLFEEDVYHKIPSFQSELMGEMETMGKDDRSAFKDSIAALAEIASNDNKKVIGPILMQLFPHPSNQSDESLTHMREFRICSYDGFDRYFLFNVPTGKMSNEEVSRMLSLVEDVAALTKFLRDYHEQDQLLQALHYLEASLEKVKLEHPEKLLTVLFNLGDEEEIQKRDFGAVTARNIGYATVTFDVSERIAWTLLKQEENENTRAELVLKATQNTSGIYLPVRLICLDIRRHNEKKGTCLLPESSHLKLRQACVEKLSQWSTTPQFSKHCRFYELLYWWKQIAPTQAIPWVANLLTTRTGVLDFLNTYLADIHEDAVAEEAYLNAAVAMEAFISMGQLTNLTKGFGMLKHDYPVIEKLEKACAALENFKKQNPQPRSEINPPPS